MLPQHKFKNTFHTVNGVKYHSKKEGQYSLVLGQRKQDGKVLDWERQKMLTFRINGVLVARYKMDFVTRLTNGGMEFIEIKGMMLPDWKIKWRLLEAFVDDPAWRTTNGLPKSDTIALVIIGAPSVQRWVDGERKPKKRKK